MTRVSRLDPGEVEGLPRSFASVAELNVARTMANNPAATAGFFEYMDVLYEELPAADRETVILAVARACDSRYEWHQHAPVAADTGLSDAEIRAIGSDDPTALSGKRRALAEYAQAYSRREVTDDLHDALAAHYTEAEIVAIGLICGFYTGLAGFLDAMAVEPEEEFVGWELG